jgi:general secretion pathway protein F
MSAFRYSALAPDGKTERGNLEGGSARQIREQLRARGLTPLEVTPIAGDASTGARQIRVSTTDFTLFARLVGALLEAGLELESALRSSAAQAPARIDAFYATVLSRVLQGTALADALHEIRGVPPLSIAAIAAGEKSGQLAAVLLALAEHGERRANMRGRIAAALAYPTILTLVSLSVAVALVTYVVPEVTRVFDGYQRELPWLTQWLIALSDFLRNHAIALVTLLAILVFVVTAGVRTRAGQVALERLLSATPGLGAMRRAIDRERFLDTLGMLLAGGVPVVEALRAAAAVVGTAALRAGAERGAIAVEGGRTLVEALAPSGLLTPVGAQLVAAGEEAARLEQMLERAARIEAESLTRRLDLVLAMLEPALVLLMGGVVLLIVLAILLPIFELNTLIA